MAAVENVVVNSKTGVDGNSYTTSISNDKLTNQDFLKLLLEEMKMQDPTKPMDSQALMDSQLKMSQIEANSDMSQSLAALTSAYSTSSLASAVGLMGKRVQNGELDENTKLPIEYKVETIENKSGEIFVNLRKIESYHSDIYLEGVKLKYDQEGNLYNDDNTKLDYHIRLEANGKLIANQDGKVYYNNQNQLITDQTILNKFSRTQDMPLYSDELVQKKSTSLTKIL